LDLQNHRNLSRAHTMYSGLILCPMIYSGLGMLILNLVRNRFIPSNIGKATASLEGGSYEAIIISSGCWDAVLLLCNR
jgi:hypothetical protein